MLKPFSQIPVYDENTMINIPINDFIEIQDFLKVFSQPFQLVQNAYYRAIQNKTITFKYLEEDGTEISEDEARERVKQFSNSTSE